MFLSSFSIEKKYLFRDLSIYAAKADDDFGDDEKLIIDAHCAEMRIDNNNYVNDVSYDDTLSKIVEIYTPEELRMAYLEVMSVLLADNDISDMEDAFIEDISEHFGMNNVDVDNAKRALFTLKKSYSMISEFISGK